MILSHFCKLHLNICKLHDFKVLSPIFEQEINRHNNHLFKTCSEKIELFIFTKQSLEILKLCMTKVNIHQLKRFFLNSRENKVGFLSEIKVRYS